MKQHIPLQQVLSAFTPEELEAIYPGITAPGGMFRYAKGDATGQMFIEPPEAVRAMAHGAKHAKQAAGAEAKKMKMSKDEMLGAFQKMIQGAAPVMNQGAGQPLLAQNTAAIGPASIVPPPAFPGVTTIARGPGIGPLEMHKNIQVALDE